MARYLIEKAPQVRPVKVEKPAEEARLENIYVARKREAACQTLSELCLFRCLRPDLLKHSMERLISLVLNPSYADFRRDLLEPFLRERNVVLPGESGPLSPGLPDSSAPAKQKTKRL